MTFLEREGRGATNEMALGALVRMAGVEEE